MNCEEEWAVYPGQMERRSLDNLLYDTDEKPEKSYDLYKDTDAFVKKNILLPLRAAAAKIKPPPNTSRT